MIDEGHKEAASEAAFKVTSMILHGLRPKLRMAVAEPFLAHPAYAEGNFPIWWQHQNNDQFIKQPKPPFFVRFSHHPSHTYQGVFNGFASVQCYAQTEPWVEALRDIVLAAFPNGEAGSWNGFEVTILVAEARGNAWPSKGWDSTKPWPEKADFMIPTTIRWRIPVGG